MTYVILLHLLARIPVLKETAINTFKPTKAKHTNKDKVCS